MSTSAIASSDKIQTALTNLGIPNGFIAYDTVPLLRQLVVALGNVTTGGGGSGTVTSFAFTDANGISGTVANATTTPTLSLSLGAITPTSVNGLTLTAAATGFTVAGGATSKTLTVSNTLSLAGVDSSVLTIPATGTAALLGTAQSFTAAQTISVNGAASTPPLSLTGTWFTGGSATTTKPSLLVEPSGTTSTGWSTSGTGIGVNAPNGFGGNLLDLQTNGTSLFKVSGSGDGEVTAVGGLYVLGASITTGLQIWTSYPLRWATASSTRLHGGTANTLEVRNSTSSQTMQLFGTYTDASNYRRLTFSSTTGGTFSIAPEGAGTGASGNVLHISGLPTSNPGPGILWNNAGTPAIGT